MSSYTEKRAYPRFTQKAAIRFIHPDSNQYQHAEMRNYSKGGMLFRSDAELEPGNNICIRSAEGSQGKVLPQPRKIYVAEVRSCRPVHLRFLLMYDVGVKYLQKFSDDEWPSYWLPLHENQKPVENLPGLTLGSLDEANPENLQQVLYDLQAHQLVLKKQNENLRQSQLELKASLDRYTLLYDFAPIGYFTIDRSGHIQEVNLTGAKLLDTEKTRLIKALFSIYVKIEDREILYRHFSKAFKTSKRENCEVRLKRKNGSPCYVRLDSIVGHYIKDDFDRLLTTVTDITAQKTAEKSKKNLESLLLQVKKMESLGTIAGGIAHNFNNLLMAIQGHVSVMMFDMEPHGAEFDHLRGIERMIQRATRLTRALISFAQVEKCKPISLDLNELILNTTDLIARNRKDINIRHKLQEKIWPVEADRNQIEQVFINIVNNSLQAIQGGGSLLLQTENAVIENPDKERLGLKHGRYIKISVIDSGTGMDPATQERIFDPFFTTKEVGKGTGLGLATVYGVVNRHGGIIRVSSRIKEGTTFCIYLPASIKKHVFKPIHPGGFYRGTERILFVENDDQNLDTGAEMLIELGHPLLIAGSGREALEIFRKQYKTIDLVILDLTMPEMDGLEAYRKMVEIDSAVKILLTAEYVDRKQFSTAHDQGSLDFIQKPFQLRELSKKLKEMLNKNVS